MASTYMEDVVYAIERAEASKSWSPRTMRYFSEGEKQMVRDRLLLARVSHRRCMIETA